uniref:Uncharacterized protein n=1 Tax=viral metagenome TaxID=1070528 RepID=A0A6C0ASJ6_9ZZZZ
MAKTPRELIMEKFMGELPPMIGELEENAEIADDTSVVDEDEENMDSTEKGKDEHIDVDTLKESDVQEIHYLKDEPLSKDFGFQRDFSKAYKLGVLLYKINSESYKPFLEFLLKSQDNTVDIPLFDLNMEAFTEQPLVPTQEPSQQLVQGPSLEPTLEPEQQPSLEPTRQLVQEPEQQPSLEPTQQLVQEPEQQPSQEPTQQLAQEPEQPPSQEPTQQLVQEPEQHPSLEPIQAEQQPTQEPEQQPTQEPIQAEQQPTQEPEQQPTQEPEQQLTQELDEKKKLEQEQKQKELFGGDDSDESDDPFFRQCAKYYESLTSQPFDKARNKYKGFVELDNNIIIAVFDHTDEDETVEDKTIPANSMTTAIVDEIVNKKKVLDLTVGENMIKTLEQHPILQYILNDETSGAIDIPIVVYICKEAPDSSYDNVFYESEEEQNREHSMIYEPIFHEQFGSTHVFSKEPLDENNQHLIKRFATFTQNTVYLLNKNIPLGEYSHLKEKLSVCFWENDSEFFSVKTTDLFIEL